MEPATKRGRSLVVNRSQAARAELVQAVGLFLDPELGQHETVGAEGIGLDDVGPRGQERLVDLADDIGTALDQDVGAVLAAAVVGVDVEVAGVDGGAHRAVEDQDAAADLVEKPARHVVSISLLRI
jgi:hypothetical protein